MLAVSGAVGAPVDDAPTRGAAAAIVAADANPDAGNAVLSTGQVYNMTTCVTTSSNALTSTRSRRPAGELPHNLLTIVVDVIRKLCRLINRPADSQVDKQAANERIVQTELEKQTE